MEKVPQVDPTVLAAIKNGDKRAYAAIYRIYYSRLYNYGYKFTRNILAIEDCIQEVLTSFWINRQKIESITSFESYLFVSFRNRLLKSLQEKQLNTETLRDEDYQFELELSIDQLMINADSLFEQQTNLKAALNNLTERQKEAIYFKYYENLEYEQIARILNISTKATYKLVARAIAELRLVYQQNVSSFLLLLTMSVSCSCP
jgi:RNA polymerase sigma factor (sigma-70 family)